MKEAKSSLSQFKRCYPSKNERKPEFQLPIKETDDLRAKMEEIYSIKYEDHITDILTINQAGFMNQLFKDINHFLKVIFPYEALLLSPLSTLVKTQEKLLEQKYTYDYKMISSAWNDYEMNAQALLKYSNQLSIKNNENFSFLKHYRKHCGQCDTYAIHSCNKKSKLIEITDEDDNISYVICTECKEVYMSSMIKLHCFNCDCDYLSSILSKNESVDILPATWEKYHCGSFINKTMKCIKCQSTLYLNIKTNFLMCIEKDCKFISKPNSIVWNCVVCQKDFYCNAKIFNPLDVTLTKKAIRLSILLQKKAYPSEMNCCFEGKTKTEEEIAELTFTHKSECNGIMYQGKLNGQEILVCSKCKAMNFLEKFIWTCPICKIRFKPKSTELLGYSTSLKGKSSTNLSQISTKGLMNSCKKEEDSEKPVSEITPMRYQRKKYKTLIEILDKRVIGLIKKPLFQHPRIQSGEFSIDYNPITTEPNDQIKDKKKSKTNDFKKDCKSKFIDYESNGNAKTNTTSNANDNIYDNDQENKSKYLFTDTAVNYSSSSQSTKKDKDLIRISKKSRIPPFCVDDYNILHSVGEGSFGKIYLIQSKKTQECFALKKIIAHDIEEVEKYQKEFELVYSVKHENIMKIFNIEYKSLDFCTYSLYVLMELADSDWSSEITARISCKKYYKERELIHALKQLTSSLCFLQKKSISHRDIKPQNVLIYRKELKYKVADFGEAKEIKIAKIQQNTLKGTELYMSPLLYDGLKRNKAEINHNPYKSDVFSLGYCVLYAATLTLNVLTEIREIKDMKIISSIVTQYLSGRYSDQLKNLLIKLLEVDESKRYDFVMLEKEIDKMSY